MQQSNKSLPLFRIQLFSCDNSFCYACSCRTITGLRGMFLDVYFTRAQTTKINDTYKLKGKHLILYYAVWHHPHPFRYSRILNRIYATMAVLFRPCGSTRTKKSGHPASQTFVWLKLNFIMIFRKYKTGTDFEKKRARKCNRNKLSYVEML